MYDVYVARLGGTTYAVRSNGRVIAKVPSGTDCSRLLKAAVDAVPSGGSLNIRGGLSGSGGSGRGRESQEREEIGATQGQEDCEKIRLI